MVSSERAPVNWFVVLTWWVYLEICCQPWCNCFTTFFGKTWTITCTTHYGRRAWLPTTVALERCLVYNMGLSCSISNEHVLKIKKGVRLKIDTATKELGCVSNVLFLENNCNDCVTTNLCGWSMLQTCDLAPAVLAEAQTQPHFTIHKHKRNMSLGVHGDVMQWLSQI